MRILLISFLLLSAFQITAQEKDTFLIEKGYYERSRWTIQDTSLAYDIIKKASEITYAEAERAERLCRTALYISNKLESSEGKVRAYLGISTTKLHQNQNDSALYYINKGQSIAQGEKLRKLEVKCLEQKSAVYTYKEQYDKATQLSFEAIKQGGKISEQMTIRSYATLGHIFMKLGNLKRSSEYSQKGLRLGEKYKDSAVMMTSLNILGLNYKNTDKNEDALEAFEKGLEIARKVNNLQRQSQILYNMSNVYFNMNDYDKGFECFNESIEISKVNGSYLSTAISFHSYALTSYELEDGPKSMKASDSALHYGLLSGNYEMIMEAYALKSNVEAKYGSILKAYRNLEQAYNYKDSLNLVQLNDASVSAEDAFQRERKAMRDSIRRENDKLELKNERRLGRERVQARERLIWVFAIALILFLVAGYFIIKNNRLIKSQNALVNSQKEEIQQQHSEIRDSIDYAQRIQAAMINKRSEWDKLGTHFIFFRPKDVVSGDFYWAHNKADLSIWVVADCTGHGVPGAFMSMLGFGFLNEIVIERDCSDAAEILNLLRAKIVSALGEQGENQARDGMDVSICIWNRKSNELQYAGANNPLWIIRHKSSESPESVKRVTTTENSALQLLEIEPDKIPVGFVDGSSKPFTNKTIQLYPGDTIVQLTDGYADQFGGPKGKKMKYAPLKRSLIEMQSLQFDQQFETLSKNFDDWRGDLEQIDDVCVVAVKVS